MSGPNSETAVIDSSLPMQTPEGIEYVLFPAGIAVRACAWGIDTLIKGLLLFVLFVFTSAVLEIFGVWFYFLLNFALDWFYFAAFEMMWNGQTPGKRIMGIRVVNGDGSPVSAGASFIRNLLRFADGFFYLYLIAFVCMIASPGFRRIGDWAGNTLVIYAVRPGRFTANRQAIPWLSGYAAQVPDQKLDYREKQGILMFARRFPLLGKNRADEIARPLAVRLRGPAAPANSSAENSVSDSEYLLGIARTLSGG